MLAKELTIDLSAVIPTIQRISTLFGGIPLLLKAPELDDEIENEQAEIPCDEAGISSKKRPYLVCENKGHQNLKCECHLARHPKYPLYALSSAATATGPSDIS